MKNISYRSLLSFISVVILITLGIQLYWNYKNYKVAEQQMRNEVQSSLDEAVDQYYLSLSDRLSGVDIRRIRLADSQRKMDQRILPDPLRDDMPESAPEDVRGQKPINHDSLVRSEFQRPLRWIRERGGSEDSLRNILRLTSRFISTITTDTINLEVLRGYFDRQLHSREINMQYTLSFDKTTGRNSTTEEAKSSVVSQSAYLPFGSRLEVQLENETPVLLRRTSLGIVLSSVLIICVVGCLFFLLKIIRRQKRLSEIKDDLLSNISHEFKTPISIVKVALEGVENFREEKDRSKRKNYLEVSHDQLNKLQFMVDKLLEAATLEVNEIQQKTSIDLVTMVRQLHEKYRNLFPEREMQLEVQVDDFYILGDPFYLENALNNIYDNAIKYGGNKIVTTIKSASNAFRISIKDSGEKLTRLEAEQIFEKFYRVPKGNLHEVKGYGIGLYYTREIIRKHGGKVEVKVRDSTDFIISFPNERKG